VRAAFALPIAAALIGCVTQGAYDQEIARGISLERQLRERDAKIEQLETRVRRLEATGESLSGERLKLLEELEDLREQAEQVRTQLDHERELRTQEIRQVSDRYHSLVEELESEVAAGRLEIERLQEGLQVRAGEAILFDSGSAELKPEGRDVLARLGEQLRELRDHEVRVEGHTDDRPIQTARFPSNWELSAARAAVVARELISDGVSPARVGATGFGAERPLEPNDTAEGRARNRRIEIVLIPVSP
jgi:chemotaxis protein MotB